MKALLTVVALSVATVAFAQTTPNPPTQAECEKMSDKRWDTNSKMCLPK